MADKEHIKAVDALLASSDADFREKLAEYGYEKTAKSSVKGLDLKLSDQNEMLDNIVVTVYETLRDGFVELMANNGLFRDEARMQEYLGWDESAPIHNRNFADAVKEMQLGFEELVENCVDAVQEKFPGIDTRDVLSRIQFPQIMRRVIELPMMQPLEPAYVLQPLFKRLSVPGMFGDVARFTFPLVGVIQPVEMGEDAEAPEKVIDLAGGTMAAKFAKIGVGFKYSEDFRRYENFDWFGLIMNACRQSLARERERRAYRAIADNGSPVIDNTGRFGFSGAPTAGTVGTAGTGIDGLRNGTHVLQDLFYMMTDFTEDGLFPDTLVLSPRAWLIWAQSPEMRAFAFQNGIPQMWQMPRGAFGNASEHDISGGLFGHNGDHPRGSTTYTEHPTNMLPLPLRIVVSPFVESGTDSSIEYTNAHMLDVSSGIGYFLEAQPVTMSQWVDPEHDIEKVRFTERYAFGTLRDNLAIRHMVKIKTREIGVDARDKLIYSINWAGGVGGPHLGNV